MRLLMTGGGGAGTEGLERLWRDVHEVHFADADPAAIPPSVPSHRRHGIPMAGPQWPAAIADLCRSLSIEVLVATVDEELPFVPTVVDLVPTLQPLVPSATFVRLMKDKLSSMVALREAGLDAPRTQTLDRAADIGFPCLVKPRDGRGSRGVHILDTQRQLEGYAALSGRPADQLVVQEVLKGQEWTVYVSADRGGRLRSVVPMRVDLKRGVTVRAETVFHPGIIDYCRAIHDRFPTAGPFNVQLMETVDGRLAAFEVNPRVSTTLCLAVAAGADPVADFTLAEQTAALRPFVAGVRLRRNWLNHFERAE